MRRVVSFLVLVASTTACVANSDECQNTIQGVFDHSTDVGDREYVDMDRPSDFTPLATAVNGTQRFSAHDDTCRATTPLMLTSVRAQDPQLATVTFTSSTFDFTPLAAGAAMVQISGDTGGTTDSLHAADIDHVALVGPELGEPGAFYVGASFAMIQLLDSTGAPLVDRNVSVASGPFQLGDKWNHLAINNMPAGSYSLSVNAGGRAWSLDTMLVDHLTGVVPVKDSVAGLANEGTDVCFFAYLGPTLVAGVPWHFDFDSHYGKVSTARANCVTVTDAAGNMRMVHAQALGFSASATVTFY